jgi:hypothetical protein
MTLPNRTLVVIVDELRAALRHETSDILTIGNLLIEAKVHLPHGEWLPWLKKEFSLSERSAQKYMKAADFAAKNALGADLKLRPSALYLLSEDGHWGKGDGRSEATEAVIKAASEQWVDQDRATEIIEKTREEKAAAKAPITEENSGGSGSRVRSPINAKDNELCEFSARVRELVRLCKGQKPERYAKTSVSADSLEMVGQLLLNLSTSKKPAGSGSPTAGREGSNASPDLTGRTSEPPQTANEQEAPPS